MKERLSSAAVRRRALLTVAAIAAIGWFHRPTPTHLAETLPNLGDPPLNVWALRWVGRTLLTNPSDVFDANAFWPAPDSLTYSEPVIPIGLLFGLLDALGAGPVLAYNLVNLFLVVLAMVGGYLLAHHLTGRTDASALAAVVCAFNGFALSHQAQIQLLVFGALPLVLLFLLRLADEPTARRAVGLAAAVVLVSLTSLYFAALLGVAVPAALAVLAWQRRLGIRSLAHIAAAGAAAGLAIGPVALVYQDVHVEQGFGRTYDPIYALDVEDLFTPIYGSTVYDGLSDRLLDDNQAPNEHVYFAGFLTTGLAVVGLGAAGATWLPRRGRPEARSEDDADDDDLGSNAEPKRWQQDLLVVLAAGAAGAVVAVGEELAGIPMPYQLLRETVPGFDGVRALSRFAVVTVLAVGFAGAAGWAALARRLPPAASHLAGAVVVGLVVVELMAPPVHQPFDTGERNVALHRALSDGQGAVVELPLLDPRSPTGAWPYVEAPRMVMSTYDWRPRVNGFSGYWPNTYEGRPEEVDAYLALAIALQSFPDATSLEWLDDLDVRTVVLRTGKTAAPVGFQQLTEEEAQAIIDRLPKCAESERIGRDWVIQLCG